MSTPILVALTPSPRGRDALDLAIEMARVTGRPLVLGGVALMAEMVPVTGMVGWTGDGVNPRELESRAADDLRAMAATVPDDVPAQVATVAAYNVAVGIEQLAAKHDAALIVLGATHRNLLARVVEGDPVLGVLRHAKCAVLVTTNSGSAGAGLRPSTPKRIAVAWDRSPGAAEALAFAADLTQRAGATLDVVHVLEPQAPVFMPPADPKIGREQLDDRTHQAKADIRRALDALPETVDAAVQIRTGEAEHELASATTKADLLVVGSHRRGPIRRVIAGSVSERLLHHAPCPVLITPRDSASVAVA